jgi:hypothetical protein
VFFNVFMAEQLHNVENILSFMIFDCSLPTSESVECHLKQTWVLQWGGPKAKQHFGQFTIFILKPPALQLFRFKIIPSW